jgi:hypothetical protein
VFDWLGPPALLHSVVVNLIADPDTAISGVLWQSRGPWLVLRKASVLKPNLEPMPVDGDVLVHRHNVAFVQVLP